MRIGMTTAAPGGQSCKLLNDLSLCITAEVAGTTGGPCMCTGKWISGYGMVETYLIPTILIVAYPAFRIGIITGTYRSGMHIGMTIEARMPDIPEIPAEIPAVARKTWGCKMGSPKRKNGKIVL